MAYEHDTEVTTPVDLLTMLRTASERKPVWARQCTDLNVNLISLASGEGIGSHVNSEVDVLLIGIDGAGTVEVAGRSDPVAAGHVVLIPKGSQRAITCDGDRFAYLTCHRRRAGLMPETPRRQRRSDES